MDTPLVVVKFKRGTAAKLARVHRLSVNHVVEVFKGNRKPTPALLKSIEREKERQGIAA